MSVPAPKSADTISAPQSVASRPPTQNQSSQQQQQQQQQPSQEEKEPIVPRDVRLLHLIFATQGIQNYQDHVPLQLMDFAHKYTKSVLKDALIYNDHAKTTSSNVSSNSGATVNTDDIRLAIAARGNYQFKPVPPKELMLELAQERNSKPLPPVIPKWGLNLPPEKYCLTAKDWDSIYDEPEADGGDGQDGQRKKSKRN